uniref:Uncharacterized protein n=1 Tax=Glossina pallidipes TaxID=7398 RepID=A0A1A9ZMU8_GLOPL
MCRVGKGRFLNSIYEQTIVVLLPKPYMKMKLMYTIEKLSSISSSSGYCTTAVTEDVSIVTYNSNGGWQQWHHPHHPSFQILLIGEFPNKFCPSLPTVSTKYERTVERWVITDMQNTQPVRALIWIG